MDYPQKPENSNCLRLGDVLVEQGLLSEFDVNLILKRLASVSGFLNASKTANLVREKREFDVQAALIRQTLAAPVLIIS